MPYRGSVIPSAKELGDGYNSLVDTLGRKKKEIAGKANFGPNDSTIGSAVLHPMEGFEKALEWLQQQVNIASGMPTGDQDEGSMYQMGNVNPEARAQAALNLAGTAQMGSMPMSPQSAGGTLGTLVSRGSAGRGNYPMPEGTGMSSGNFINGPTYDADFKTIYGGKSENIDEVSNALTNQLLKKKR